MLHDSFKRYKLVGEDIYSRGSGEGNDKEEVTERKYCYLTLVLVLSRGSLVSLCQKLMVLKC